MRTLFYNETKVLTKTKKIIPMEHPHKNGNTHTFSPEEIKQVETLYAPPLTKQQIHWKHVLDKIIPDMSDVTPHKP